MADIEGRRVARRFPIGAEALPGGGVHFRVWAPSRKTVEVDTQAGRFPLTNEEEGYYSGLFEEGSEGLQYKLRLDAGDPFPDPASRFQPEGPHGPSQVVDATCFPWSDGNWGGPDLRGQVIYEMHIGTFTREGTWESAIKRLPYLAQTGLTVLELMPVADFAGAFGWGYDGVNWWAPTRLYGSPDDMRKFVDKAHSLGMAVILDVVYNHFGPDGCYMAEFSPRYFTEKYGTDWGAAINFDGEDSQPVREYVLSNARYWVEEFHLDGLRLDATQNIYDESKDHILAGIARTVREAAGHRRTILIGENEPQEIKLVRPPEKGGYGLDALWNDDYHHSAVVALTGRNEAYYTDYLGEPQEFVSAMKYGYLYQGQWYKWQKQRRGSPSLNLPLSAFVIFIENHDQVANSARGMRMHQLTSPGLYRAVTALTLLGTGTPMLFQGQEFASSAPFLFFADLPDSLRDKVREGRCEFLKQWRSIRSSPAMLQGVADPSCRGTFDKCKLDHSERDAHPEMYRFHCDLIRLKRSDPTLLDVRRGFVDGAVLPPRALVLRFFDPSETAEFGDRLLVVNLGVDVHLHPAPEPLLAPPDGRSWHTLFSTEAPEYGGSGVADIDAEEQNWLIPGWSATLLGPGPRRKPRKQNTNEETERK